MAGLGVVVATIAPDVAGPCLASWKVNATGSFPLVVVENGGPIRGQDYLGPVGAFRVGVERMMHEHPEAEVIACFHDDLVILEAGWDERVMALFAEQPGAGLVSFDGAVALGTEDLHELGYHPDRLSREPVNGGGTQRVVAPADFCAIGRRWFWSGFNAEEWRTRVSRRKYYPRPWPVIDDLGIVDHFYDGALGCLARRGGWQVWYLPVRYRHLGGQATSDPHYQRWAEATIEGGDRGFWEKAHRLGYEHFKDELPLRL